MTDNFSPLEWGPISMVRRNHGLEHATINLLSKAHPNRAFAGHSDTGGFWITGNVSTEELTATANDALVRMNAGQHGLAIHAHCGTNAATTGVIAGSLAWLGMLNSGNNWKKKLDRLPLVILLVTGAVILAAPLGPKVQEKVTTSGTPGALHIVQVTRYERGSAIVHRVATADALIEEAAGSADA
jgi:hypothetical protein